MIYAALALAAIGFLLALGKGRQIRKLEEELSRLKSLEASYRELRRDLDGKLDVTRKHLALVNDGKKLPADAILSGKPPEDLSGEEEILHGIKATIEGNKIAIFMKGTPESPQCGFSAGVVDVFNGMKVPFVGVNAVAHPKFRTVLSRYSNWPTLPQVFVNGKLVGGADIVKEMKASGDLDKLVAEALSTPAS